MTPVTARCTVCGEVKFTTEQISLITYDAGAPSQCMWRCPRCDSLRMQDVEATTRHLLWQAGVRVLRIHLEPPRAGVLDLDYMIVINDDLEHL